MALTLQQEEFLSMLEGMVGSLQFFHPDTEGGNVKGFCVVGEEILEEEAGAFERTVITTATSYDLDSQDLVVICHPQPTGMRCYRVGPNISSTPDIIYKAVLDLIADEDGGDDDESSQTFEELVYAGGKEVLVAGENITITEDDGAETLTISATASGGPVTIGDKTVGERALTDEVDARLLPSALGDAGQVVAVNGDADGVEWVDPQSGPPGRDGVDGRDGSDATVVINYVKVAKDGTNWTDLITGTNYNENYIYRITAIVNNDHTETVSIRGGDLALQGIGTNGLKMFIRNQARSCDIRLSKGKIQGRLDDTHTCTFTVTWVPIAVTTVSIS